jgi:hypothetical protein
MFADINRDTPKILIIVLFLKNGQQIFYANSSGFRKITVEKISFKEIS